MLFRQHSLIGYDVRPILQARCGKSCPEPHCNPDRDLQQTWSYSQELRFAAVSASTAEGAADPFIYAYEANSTLLDGYARGAFTVSRDYEPNRDLVTRLETKFGSAAGNTVARFDATYDPLARRQTAKQSGAAFNDYTAGQTYGAVYQVFRYNARNELESASLYRGDTPTATPLAVDELPGRRFEYRYDSLGNRRTAGATGAGSATAGVGDDDYTVNALNQYVARENNKVAVAGTAAPNATVSVATASSTSRKDRAFGAEVAPANASGPVLAPATVSAALAGAGPGGADLVRTDQRTQLVPARAQAFTYDADGNLTADGLWLYTYDAENRLVRMTSALPAGFGSSLGHVRLRLDFKYDYQGRRIEKRVTNLDTSSETLARRFLYEGWNLIAELTVSPLSSDVSMVRSYAWGLDGRGNLRATSNPGALLQITAYVNGAPAGNYYPGYDQQGNVVSLTRASDGFLAAVYEYDPFGNPVRSEPLDPAVADQPFRYANKWRDEETGLVYYGHRYYSPTMGRFINQDPIGEAGGLNLYGFVGNNVVNLSDYLGWETTDADRFNGGDPLEGFGIDFGSSTVRSGNYGGSIFWDLFNTQEELAATTLIDQANQALDGDQPPPEVQTAPPDVVVADPGPAPGPTANNLLDGIFFVASPGVESPSVPPSAPRATGPVTLTASGGGTAIGTGGSGGATSDLGSGTTGTTNGTAADTVTISEKNTGADKTSTGSTTVQDASDNPNQNADTPGSNVDLPGTGGDATNASNPIDIREQTHGRGDAESTAAAQGLLDTLRSWNLPNGSPTEIAKRIAIIEASGRSAAIYATNEKLDNAYAIPILRDGSPTGGYVLINPREVSRYSGPSKGIYSDPFGTLAHELTHLSDFITSGYSRSIQDEFEAVRVENQLRALQGFPLREYYGKTPIPNYDQYVYRPNPPSGP